jgi:hypothetical protein
MSSGLLQDKCRCVAGVLAASGPRQCAERQIAAIQREDIHEVACFCAPGQGEKLVYRRVRVMQAIAKFIVLLNRKESKGAVLSPFDLELLVVDGYQAGVLRSHSKVNPAFCNVSTSVVALALTCSSRSWNKSRSIEVREDSASRCSTVAPAT